MLDDTRPRDEYSQITCRKCGKLLNGYVAYASVEGFDILCVDCLNEEKKRAEEPLNWD